MPNSNQYHLPLSFPTEINTKIKIITTGGDDFQNYYTFAIIISNPNFIFTSNNTYPNYTPKINHFSNNTLHTSFNLFQSIAKSYNINTPSQPNISIYNPNPQYNQNSIILYI